MEEVEIFKVIRRRDTGLYSQLLDLRYAACAKYVPRHWVYPTVGLFYAFQDAGIAWEWKGGSLVNEVWRGIAKVKEPEKQTSCVLYFRVDHLDIEAMRQFWDYYRRMPESAWPHAGDGELGVYRLKKSAILCDAIKLVEKL